MEIKEISLGRIGLDKESLIGLSVVAFSNLVGASKDTVQNALIPIHQGKYAPQALQHLLKKVFVNGLSSRDRFIRVEAVDDLLHYFGIGSNRFRKPAARDAIAKFAEYGGFVSYVYQELEQAEQRNLNAAPFAEPADEVNSFDEAIFAVNWEQYKTDSQLSREAALPRRVIPLARGIEVFGLPGFEKYRGRYLLSRINAAEAVGKDEYSIRRFLGSTGFKALLDKASEFGTFSVEGAQRPIVGIPPEFAYEYWLDQTSKGNKQARILVRAFGVSCIEHYADLEFGINRTKEEQVQRLQDLFWRTDAGTYSIHFKQEYYSELYRVLPYKQPTRPGSHPAVFGTVTRYYFYEIMPCGKHDIFKDRYYFFEAGQKVEVPGGVQSLFKDREKPKDCYWHQYLTPAGDALFLEAMASFLTFLRGLDPCNWETFVAKYRNSYGKAFQTQLNLFPDSKAA